ncbi:NADP-dependent oxidoreductase domain-containing protein [Bisporella sp. PMI_857]|nr:NADP-dependent oxidoreductase domain-containing protein [Bisporella sp. PMI_857]
MLGALAVLERLGVDFIDLYYCHRVDMKTPVEKTIEAMVELKRQGKMKYLGISEISAATLRCGSAVHQIHALQMEYSPFEIAIEDPSNAVLRTARELGVALVAYSPLEDFEDSDLRKITPRFMGDNFSKNLDILQKFEDIAQGKGATAGDDIFLIPGYPKTIKYLEENTNAASVKLSDSENKELRSLIEAADVQGARIPEA